jgi:hypothetical protein
VHNLAYVGLPYTIQGLNSIACQGVNGETSLFGDALWLVDFPLWAAAHVCKIYKKPPTLSRILHLCSSTKG